MPFPKIVAGGRGGHSAARRDHAGSSSVLRAVTMRNCCCATQRKAKRVAIASKSENRNFADRREQRGLSVPRARSHQRCHHLFGFGLLASKHQGPRSLVKLIPSFLCPTRCAVTRGHPKIVSKRKWACCSHRSHFEMRDRQPGGERQRTLSSPIWENGTISEYAHCTMDRIVS